MTTGHNRVNKLINKSNFFEKVCVAHCVIIATEQAKILLYIKEQQPNDVETLSSITYHSSVPYPSSSFFCSHHML